MNFITETFDHYGYIVLFCVLIVELIALPTPGETLMTYCGFLVFQGRLNWATSIAVAAAGTILGITTSYFIGRILGNTFFAKYGHYIHMGPERLNQTSIWFQKYGNGLLLTSYYIPGFRHITGYFAGVTRISYPRFALTTYTGAIIWTGSFITLGKLLGYHWDRFHASSKKYLIVGAMILFVIFVGVYLFKSRREQLISFVNKMLHYAYQIFHTLGKVKIAVTAIGVALIGLVILVAKLTQDFMAQEFGQFDESTAYLIGQIFLSKWKPVFHVFQYATVNYILILTTILTSIWIKNRKNNSMLELKFLLIAVLGGEVLEDFLVTFFQRRGPLALTIGGERRFTFPSENALMATILYGFAAFLLARHIKRHSVKTLIVLAAIMICFFAGLSRVYLISEYPSDVFAGYVFGGVWLCINIILLEIFRIIPDITLYEKVPH